MDRLDKAKSFGQAEKLADNAEKFDIWLDFLDGTASIPGDVKWSKHHSTFRSIITTAKLGMATLSSFPDIVTRVVNAQQNGVNVFTAYGEAFARIFRGRGAKKMQELMGDLGEGAAAQTGEIMSRWTAADTVSGKMHKMMTTYFKYSLLTWWTQSHRTGQASLLSRALARTANQKFDALPAKSVLQQYINGSQWDVIRAHAVVKGRDNADYINPMAIRDIPDDVMTKLIGTNKRRRIIQAREDLEVAIRTYFVDQADFAVPTPGGREGAILKGGAKPGTVTGEGFRYLFQFKAFPITLGAKVLSGLFGNREIGLFVHMFVAMSVLGYVTLLAKDVAKNRTPRLALLRGEFDPKLMFEALLQGGGLGIYGDFLFADTNRFGGSPIITAAGPAAGDIASVIQGFGNIKDVLTGVQDGNDLDSKAFRQLVGHIPFINIFYTAAVLDYFIISEIHEYLSPGTNARLRRRLRKQKGQDFIFPK